MEVISGTSLDGIPSAIAEWVRPGRPVELIIGLGQPVSREHIAALEAKMASSGMPIRADMGSTPEWPNAMRLRFNRPRKVKGVAFLPLAVLLVGAIGAVGVTAFVGWKLGTAVTDISKRIVPLAIIAGVTFVALAYFKGQPAKGR